MMKIISIFFFVLFFLGSIYLIYPVSEIPPMPANSLISTEPADTESIYRKSYFTNMSRQEVMEFYQKNFPGAQRLNHPPEDSFPLIRDQTKSSWLEELSRIGKNSLYINGFYPTKATEQIYRNGDHYQAKITVRYIPSNKFTALTVWLLIIVAFYLLVNEYAKK